MSEYTNDSSLPTDGGALTTENPGEVSLPPSDTGEYEPEINPETGSPGPVPYDRFRESRDNLRSVKSQNESMENEIRLLREMQEQTQRQLGMSQQQALQFQQMQAQPQQAEEPSFDDDPFSDPTETRIRKLEHQIAQTQAQRTAELNKVKGEFDSYRQEQMKGQLIVQFNQTIDSAVAKYPRANRDTIEKLMYQSQKTDARSVELFAKQAQERADERFRHRLNTEGFRSPVKPMMRGGAPAAVPREFGDDLEGAHRAALEALADS